MRGALITVLMAASIGLPACSSGGAFKAMPSQADGSVRVAQSCMHPYAECITLKYRSPFEQELCENGGGVAFGLDCKPSGGKPWSWLRHLKGLGRHRHDPSAKITVSFDPNPGNPTDVTISENQRIRSSHGKVVYELVLTACIPQRGGEWCTLKRSIGIVTE